MLVKILSNQNPHTLLLEIQNGAATVKKSLVVAQNVRHKATTWSRNILLSTYPGQTNMSTQKLTRKYSQKHYSQSPKVGTTQINGKVKLGTFIQWNVIWTLKRNKVLILATTKWMKLKYLSQSGKTTNCMVPLIGKFPTGMSVDL